MFRSPLWEPSGTLRLRALPGVFRPHSDAGLLAGTMIELDLARDADVLDLCTGSGVLALSAARAGARSVTAVDLSRRAVLTTRLNARRNGLSVRTLRGDLFEPVKDRRYDLILANPPYLPGEDSLPVRGASRAWEGGPDGRVLVDRVADTAAAHLRRNGYLLVVLSTLTGERETLRRLEANRLSPQVVSRQAGPLGPLARARQALLRERDLLPTAGVEGVEELIVVAATRN